MQCWKLYYFFLKKGNKNVVVRAEQKFWVQILSIHIICLHVFVYPNSKNSPERPTRQQHESATIRGHRSGKPIHTLLSRPILPTVLQRSAIQTNDKQSGTFANQAVLADSGLTWLEQPTQAITCIVIRIGQMKYHD